VIDEYMRESKTPLKVRLALASNEAIRDLVASGMGLSVLSRHALGHDPQRDGLAILQVAGFPLKQAWNVVHLRNKILSLPAQAFLDELLNQEPGVSSN
jgi:DNA-binding transcriptional LysR family regulator